MFNKPKTIAQVYEQATAHIDRIRQDNEVIAEKQLGIIAAAEEKLTAAEDELTLADKVKDNFKELFGIK